MNSTANCCLLLCTLSRIAGPEEQAPQVNYLWVINNHDCRMAHGPTALWQVRLGSALGLLCKQLHNCGLLAVRLCCLS